LTDVIDFIDVEYENADGNQCGLAGWVRSFAYKAKICRLQTFCCHGSTELRNYQQQPDSKR